MGEKIMEKLPKPTSQRSWLDYYRALKVAYPLITSQWRAIVQVQKPAEGFYQTPPFPREMTFGEIEQQVITEAGERIDLMEELLLTSFPAFAEFMGGLEINYLDPERRLAFNKLWNFTLNLQKEKKA